MYRLSFLRALHLEPLATVLSRAAAALLVLCISLPVHAGAIDKLNQFVAATHSAQADFTQTVYDRSGKRLQASSGTMSFVRPGKFRWEYRKPYEQLIIGDGAKFWMYDPDLEQVMVRKLDAALGNSPAALLAGNNEISRNYELQESGEKEGLEWLRATAKNKEANYSSVGMGFDARGDLVAMELNDAFGNITALRFSRLQRNPKLQATQFKFVPPKGVDVMSE